MFYVTFNLFAISAVYCFDIRYPNYYNDNEEHNVRQFNDDQSSSESFLNGDRLLPKRNSDEDSFEVLWYKNSDIYDDGHFNPFHGPNYHYKYKSPYGVEPRPELHTFHRLPDRWSHNQRFKVYQVQSRNVQHDENDIGAFGKAPEDFLRHHNEEENKPKKEDKNQDSEEDREIPKRIQRMYDNHDEQSRRSSKKKPRNKDLRVLQESESETSDESSGEGVVANHLWNFEKDGDDVNLNPLAPRPYPNMMPIHALTQRGWWYFNQDDYLPFT